MLSESPHTSQPVMWRFCPAILSQCMAESGIRISGGGRGGGGEGVAGEGNYDVESWAHLTQRD